MAEVARTLPSTAGPAVHLPLLDGIRGLAAVSVLVGHWIAATGAVDRLWAGPMLYVGEVSLAVFFGMSGFLLYLPFVRARITGRRFPAVRRFFGRRVARIYPAYWLALTLLTIWPGIAGPHTSDWWQYYSLSYTATPEVVNSGLGPAWSLGAETGFYLLLPLGAYALMRRRFTLRGDLVGLGLLVLASIGFRYWASASGREWLFLNVFGCASWFCVGMAFATLYMAARNGDRRAGDWTRRLRARPAAWWAAAGMAYVTTMVVINLDAPLSFDHPAAGIEWAVFYFGMTLAAALALGPAVFADPASRSVVVRLMGNRVSVWLGAVSYGVYLWHSPLLFHFGSTELMTLPGFTGELSVFVVGAAASILCGAISWYCLERPILNGRVRRAAPSVAVELPNLPQGLHPPVSAAGVPSGSGSQPSL